MNRVMRLLMPKVVAITLFPFGIYFRDEKEDFILHELIHWRQQKEMLCIFFYLWYGVEWFIKLFFFKNAYYHISFEQEAYTAYVSKPFGWTKYLFR